MLVHACGCILGAIVTWQCFCEFLTTLFVSGSGRSDCRDGSRTFRCDQGKHQRGGVETESEGTAFHNIALSFSSSLCILHALSRSGTNYIHRRTNQNSASCEDKVVQFQRRRNETFQKHDFPLQISLNLIGSVLYGVRSPLLGRVSERSTPALGLWQGLFRHQSTLRPILEYFIPREQGLYSFKRLIANINCKKRKRKRKEM